MERLPLKGTYTLTHKDKDGKIISVETIENLITDEGKDYILDSSLNNSSSVADWFFAIYTDGTAAAGHTYATPARTEADSTINEALRQAWAEGASSSQSVTNASAATITANGSLTVSGIGVVGSPTGAAGDDAKANTACADGILLSDSDVSKSLADTETLDITYTVNA